MLRSLSVPLSASARRPSRPGRRVVLGVAALAVLLSSTSHASIRFARRAGVGEGRGFVDVTFTRSGDLAGVFELFASTSSGTASAGEDFASTSERLIWEAGVGGARTVTIPIFDDSLLEEPEHFWLEIETISADGERTRDATRIQIQDDEPPPRPTERRLAPAGNDPVVAEAQGRRFVVFGGPEGISGAFLDAEGLPSGEPFVLRDARGGPVDAPTVAADAMGRFFVAWRRMFAPPEGAPPPPPDTPPISGIEGQVVDVDGTVLGPPIELSEMYEGIVGPPRIGTNSSGESVVVFADGMARLRGRVLPPEEVIGSGTPSRQPIDIDFGILAEDYRVSTVRDGRFAVIAETPQDQIDRTGVAIAVRTWTLGGAPRRAPVVLSVDETATQPSVSRGPSGRIVAAWSEIGPGGDFDVKVAFLDEDGELSEGVVVDVDGEGNQTQPRVSVNTAGDAILVWLDDGLATAAAGSGSDLAGRGARRAAGGSSGSSSIVARSFDPGGETASEDVVVAAAETETEPSSPEVVIEDDDEATVVFERVETDGGDSVGIYSATLETTVATGACEPGASTLCLNDGRFEVTASWTSDEAEASATAAGEAITDDTGYFWFFDEDNVEIVVKVLDACGVNDRFWVFAGGLTDVGVELTVTDTQAGVSLLYVNELGSSFVPVQDTSAFETCDGSGAHGPQERWSRRSGFGDAARSIDGARAPRGVGSCDEGSLCLNGDRFELTLEFDTGSASGEGEPLTLTADTGYFWFFDEDNVEVVVKVLDACGINDRYWVFAAGLTDVEATLTVRDTTTGESQTYENALSTPFQPIRDTDAFASCGD